MKTKTGRSRYVRFAQLAYPAAQKSSPKYRRKKSKKTFTHPQLIAGELLKMYLNVSYHDCEEWLYATGQVCRALELTGFPDYSTLNRTFYP